MSIKQAAQNQHYVPKFILRKFLANLGREQVNVFQKSTRRSFSTNISNVMAERRFNEFRIDSSFYASFEESVCKVEDIVLPAYEALIDRRRLTGTPEENAMLAMFVAFQMLRTRSYRDSIAGLFDQFREHFERHDLPIGALEEFAKPDNEQIKQFHLESMAESFEEFSHIIGTKNFLLLQAPPSRSFYLADNPVAWHNDEPDNGIFSNMGLALKGIQLYVPLSSEFMLAVWCPSILDKFRTQASEKRAFARRSRSAVTLSPNSLPRSKKIAFDGEMEKLDNTIERVDKLTKAADAGRPIQATTENMDFYNVKQMQFARDFVICQRADFKLAKEFVKRQGNKQGGMKFSFG
ncbi:DUF4238 domain-containing protein [uncultured Roseovarius sp.]|uniref:DUF4238 domain-containing protein n=1 Tax=uncultured Roseovarius sp. TaxID=293344 RepID=UPI0026199A46|nr:DUF4238 domain-containing protein [uncultured Roseovarius sp.]